jgi:UDP-N-acetylmuramoyl-L-alanyl-D-glutamate--2,6-diaminopimelate ligase
MNSIGTFNIYNALAAISVCGLSGISFEDVCIGLSDVKVKGRVEVVPTGKNFTIIIDYAHNAVSLESLLLTLKEYAIGRVVCLFGCGGDRDPARRFEMGEVSGKLADFTIITSDNPRTEEPSKIIENIETGIRKTNGKYICILDRTDAIRYAIKNAMADDIIVLAGKGHENYQIFDGKTIHYDEREIVASILLNKDYKVDN